MSYKFFKRAMLVGLLGFSALYIRNCRLQAENRVLQSEKKESFGKRDLFIEYLEKNPEQFKTYLPKIISVIEEKGYLEDLIKSISPDQRRSLVLNLAVEETKDVAFDFKKDISYLVNKDSYLTRLKNNGGRR